MSADIEQQIPAQASEPRPWRIEDDDGLDWCLDMIGRAQAVIDENAARARKAREKAEAELRRVTEWQEQADRDSRATIDRMEGFVEDYAVRVRDASGGKVKSLTSPYGTVATRQGRVAWDIDQAAVIAWAKDHRPDLVETVTPEPFEKLLTDRVRKVLEPTGDGEAVDPDLGTLVPGVKVRGGGLLVTVTPVVALTPADLPEVGGEDQ